MLLGPTELSAVKRLTFSLPHDNEFDYALCQDGLDPDYMARFAFVKCLLQDALGHRQDVPANFTVLTISTPPCVL
jgi:hypothetical protein